MDGEIHVYYRDIMGWFWKTKQPRNPSEKNCQKKMTKNRIHKTIRKILTYHNVNVQFTPLDIYGTKFVYNTVNINTIRIHGKKVRCLMKVLNN